MTASAWLQWRKSLKSAQSESQAIASQIRKHNYHLVGASVYALQRNVVQLRQELERLRRSMGTEIDQKEIEQVELSLRDLEHQQEENMKSYDAKDSESKRSNDNPSHILGMQHQIMRDQDAQLDMIGKGVANLKSYSIAVKDETDLHLRLLSDMDDDVLYARNGLSVEGARAAKVARQSSNLKLYVAIIVLLVILILLLLLG